MVDLSSSKVHVLELLCRNEHCQTSDSLAGFCDKALIIRILLLPDNNKRYTSCHVLCLLQPAQALVVVLAIVKSTGYAARTSSSSTIHSRILKIEIYLYADLMISILINLVCFLKD